MAAAAVAGLIPVFHSVVGDKSGYYIGRQLWFGFIAVYGVVVYVVRMPWALINEDFYCHGNITKSCLIECFEKRFQHPVVGIWYFFFFIFLTFFFLMEFVMAQIRHKQVKVVESTADEIEVSSMVGIQEKITCPEKSILNFHRKKMLLLFYLLYFLLQVGSQCVFLYFLISQHLPLVSQAIMPCYSNNCSGTYICLIRGTMEKRMSIYTLITLSFVIILFCSGFFLYSIQHYLLKGFATSKTWPE